jgi:hypothetical protein
LTAAAAEGYESGPGRAGVAHIAGIVRVIGLAADEPELRPQTRVGSPSISGC